MKLTFVEISGFRSFKDKTRFEFPSGFVVLTGRNGVGKSTVLDAIDFALTGSINKYSVKDAKGGGLSDHIWWVGDGSAEKEYVSVGFVEEDGTNFVITRTRERDFDVNISGVSSRFCMGTQVPENWNHTLMQTSLIRDETLASLSLDLPEQARFAAVRAAIGGLAGPSHTSRTTALVQAAATAKSEQDERVQKVEAELGRTLSSLTETRSLAEKQTDIGEAEKIISLLVPDLANATSDRAEMLRKRLVELKQSISPISEIIANAERLQVEKDYFSSEMGIAEMKAAQSASDDARHTLDQAKVQLGAIQQLQAAERQSDAFASHLVALLQHGEAIGLREGHCPLCEAARSDAEFSASINAARTRLSARGQKVAEINVKLSQAQGVVSQAEKTLLESSQRLSNLEARKKNLTTGLESIEHALSKWKFELATFDIDQARKLLLKRQENVAQIERAIFILEASGVRDRATALENRVTQLRTLLEDESAKQTLAERALESAKQIDKAAKGVTNQIMAEQFDTVMPLLKELYQRLRPHTDWREIEMDFGGTVRASLNFTVGDGRNPQFLFSSGQRRAAGIAFLLAIHLSRPWCRFKSLLLDDPVQHIDDYRALNLVEVLAAVRRTGRQVIVAVEDPALADVLCRRLRSTAGEAGRRFDLCTAKNGSAKIETQVEIGPLLLEVLHKSEAG